MTTRWANKTVEVCGIYSRSTMKRFPDSIWRSCVTTINAILMIRKFYSDESQSTVPSECCLCSMQTSCSVYHSYLGILNALSSREVTVCDHVLSFLWKQNETSELQLKDVQRKSTQVLLLSVLQLCTADNLLSVLFMSPSAVISIYKWCHSQTQGSPYQADVAHMVAAVFMFDANKKSKVTVNF